MKGKINLSKFLVFLLTVLISFTVLFVLYSTTIPKKYDLSVGDKSPENIVSSRAIINKEATHQRALEQAQQVPDVFVRSEALSDESMRQLNDFFDAIDKYRSQLYIEKVENPKDNNSEVTEASRNDNQNANTNNSNNNTETTGTTVENEYRGRVPSSEEIEAATLKITEELQNEKNLFVEESIIDTFLKTSPSIYVAVKKNALNIAETIMLGDHDNTSLLVSITSQVNSLIENNSYYKNEYNQIALLLKSLLKPNMIFDEAATKAAKESTYNRIYNDPVLIPAGNTIVNKGETITSEKFQMLDELALIEKNSIDWATLSSLLLLYSLILFLMWIYFRYQDNKKLRTYNDWAVLLTILLATFFASTYLASISPLILPVYFVAILVASYFGLNSALVLSLSMVILLLPVTQMNLQYLFVAVLGTTSSALIASSSSSRQNNTLTIIGVTATNFVASILYSSLVQHSTYIMLQSAIMAALAGFLSAVLAIGVAPIVELFLSTVAPTRLIDLANANHPLLKRLFLEAPATYQHSMMVANLAEAAAERIGIDTLLARVGAYYHDVGKLWNPQMYTENQGNFNPHSLLKTKESTRIIFKHVKYGQSIAREYGLPETVVEFIQQHHGTTILQFFYTQACDEAEEMGIPLPATNEFRYSGPSPVRKEIAVVMLADTVEAAMKSTGLTDIDEVEKLIRKLVRGKVDQDQLVNSGLSFKEVEEIMNAFIHVYEGLLHERVKYPDDNRIKQANK